MAPDPDLHGPIASYLRSQLAAKGDEADLAADEPLISSGRLSSVDVLGLVAFLEDTHDLEIAAHEISADRMDTLDSIVELVRQKLAGAGGAGR